MDTHKALRIERSLNRVHGYVQHVRSLSCVHPHIILRRFNPIHFINREEDRALAGADGEARQIPPRIRDRIQRRGDLSRG